MHFSKESDNLKPIHLCIGAPRAGTTWLFRELNNHQDIFIPIVKEVRYWNARRSDAEQKSTIANAMKRVESFDDSAAQLEWLNQWQKIPQKREPSIDEYLEFMSVENRTTVDISPTYCFLNKAQIKKLKAGLPEGSKVIYLVRDPLQRLSSQFKLHYFLHGHYRGVPSLDDISTFLSNKGQQMRWDYGSVISKWEQVFGNDFSVLDYDKIHDPKQFIQEISNILQFELAENTEQRSDDSFSHSDKNQNKQTLLPTLGLKEEQLLAAALKPDVAKMSVNLPEQSLLWGQKLSRTIKRSVINKSPTLSVDINVQKLMRMTESLGDNCEYGFWQRDHGYEPSSLFRWAITPLKSLNEFLKSPTELYVRHDLKPHSPQMVCDQAFDFKFHSKLVEKNDNGELKLKNAEFFDGIYQPERDKIDFLYRKFFFQLRKKPALYLIKSNKNVDMADVNELSALLTKANSKHILLWVIQSEDEKVTLNEIGDRVFQGTVPVFAKYVSANEYHPTGWTELMSLLSREPNIKLMIDGMFR